MKVTLKGKLKKIMPGRAIKTGYVCEIVIEEKAHSEKAKDQLYPVSFFTANYGDAQSKVGHLVGKEVEAEVFLNGKEFTTSSGLGYGLSMNLKDIRAVAG